MLYRLRLSFFPFLFYPSLYLIPIAALPPTSLLRLSRVVVVCVFLVRFVFHQVPRQKRVRVFRSNFHQFFHPVSQGRRDRFVEVLSHRDHPHHLVAVVVCCGGPVVLRRLLRRRRRLFPRRRRKNDEYSKAAAAALARSSLSVVVKQRVASSSHDESIVIFR